METVNFSKLIWELNLKKIFKKWDENEWYMKGGIHKAENILKKELENMLKKVIGNSQNIGSLKLLRRHGRKTGNGDVRRWIYILVGNNDKHKIKNSSNTVGIFPTRLTEIIGFRQAKLNIMLVWSDMIKVIINLRKKYIFLPSMIKANWLTKITELNKGNK